MSSNKYGFIPSKELQQSLKTLHLFLELFPPHELEEIIWMLAFEFANSDTENKWTFKERSNFHCFYKILIKAAKAMVVIDRELN